MWVPLTYQLIMQIFSEISVAQVILSLECGIVDILFPSSLFSYNFSEGRNVLAWITISLKGLEIFYTDMLVNSAELHLCDKINSVNTVEPLHTGHLGDRRKWLL